MRTPFKVALALGAGILLGAIGPRSARADNAGSDAEEKPVREEQRRMEQEKPAPAPERPMRAEPRVEMRHEEPMAMDTDCNSCCGKTFATDRSLVGRDTENIFGPDTPMIYMGACGAQGMHHGMDHDNDMDRDMHRDRHRRSDLVGPHAGYWSQAASLDAPLAPVAVMASFSR